MLSKKLLCLFLFGAVLFEQTFGQEGGGGEGGSSEGGSSEGGSSEGGSSEGGSSEGGSSEGGSGGPSGSGGEGTTDTDDTTTSSSSSSSDSSACFDANSIVQRQIGDDWEYALLKDINLGDYVLSSVDGETMFTEVLHRLHYLANDGADEEIAMKKICSLNSCVTMTDDHLLYVNGNSMDNLVNAGKAAVGDLIYNSQENDFEAILSIENVMAYPRDVLTRSGNIVVNDIVASTYIGTNKWDHIVLETFLKSLHYLANDMPFLYDIIADGPAIWQMEEFTMRFHQAILFGYFNVYQSFINVVASLACGFGVLLFFKQVKN